MSFKFQKMGVVSVGTAEPGQAVNMQDPIGFPTHLNFNLVNGQCTMTVNVSDGLNTVVRDYPLSLDAQAVTVLTDLFQTHIRRIARDAYNEFKDLQEVNK